AAAGDGRVVRRGCGAGHPRHRRGRQGSDARRAEARTRPEGPYHPINRDGVMQRFNLSQWAITHRPLVLFAIILLRSAGVYSYLNLGRAEDPSFTIKTMIGHVGWPGATASELQAQAVDKVEKKLQELPYLDRIESYSQPGGAFIRVTLSDKTPPSKVKDLWY